jgi:hypothetical protein
VSDVLTAAELQALFEKHHDPSLWRRLPKAEVIALAATRMPVLEGAPLEWFRAALADDRRKWLAAALLQLRFEGVPALVDELLRAAMTERDPSFNRSFIRPLRHVSRAWPFLTEKMLVLAGPEDPILRGGVARAYYWLIAELGSPDAETERRLNTWCLKTFLADQDIYELRSLMGQLSFALDAVEGEDRQLVDSVIEKATSHADDYLRHRLEIQLRRSSAPFRSLEIP